MRIGIDISQIVHEGTGVGTYVREIVRELLRIDQKNEYILFGASFRKRSRFSEYFEEIRTVNPRARLVVVPAPPTILEFIWNSLHIIPVEWFIGPVDVFWSSDWTQPPLRRAKGITTIHDVSFLKTPESFTGTNIIQVQKRRLARAKVECTHFLCDSHATANDVIEFFGISSKKFSIVYPGFTV